MMSSIWCQKKGWIKWNQEINKIQENEYESEV